MSTRRSLTACGVLVLGIAVAGCGQSGSHQISSPHGIPLVAGVRIVAQTRSCDRGANPYCSLQLVVVGARYPTATALLTGEEQRLRTVGWTSTVGDTPKERSADSPGHKLRLSYALAADDLESWDLGSLKRRPSIARALAATMFERVPALSLMLQAGSS
ncbi:MAG: hypothetical protein ACR2NR_18420 [Solirubrobacteraceae bacterium]